jgi:hypothetical protein
LGQWHRGIGEQGFDFSKFMHVSDPLDHHPHGFVITTWSGYSAMSKWLEVEEVTKTTEYWSVENMAPVHYVVEGETRALCGVAVGLPNTGPFARAEPILCAECRILEKTIIANES